MKLLTDEEVAKLRETLQYAIVIKAMARYAYEEALATLDAAPTVEQAGWLYRTKPNGTTWSYTPHDPAKQLGWSPILNEWTPLYARTEVK